MKKGERMSGEQKSKISAALTGKRRGPLSEDHRAKISAALTGRTLAPEHVEKISAARTGETWSEERRLRKSEAVKKSWEGSSAQEALEAYRGSPENLANLARVHDSWARSPEGIAHACSNYIGFSKFVEPLRERDGDLCQLCLELVDFKLRRPDLMSRSVDHIVPTRAGGSDEMHNLWLSHLLCNSKKGARHLGRPDGTTDVREET